jgi:hypothetical protein
MRWKRWKKRDLRRRSKQARASVEETEDLDIDHVIIAGGEEEVTLIYRLFSLNYFKVAEFIWTHLESTQFVEIPFLLIYMILLTYIGVSSYFIAYLEEWPTRDGFYFVMMSVLTIGFGGLFQTFKLKYLF